MTDPANPNPYPVYRFDGATVIVTGAAQGIGRAIAERFAESSANVVVADHNGDAADQTAREIRDAGGRAVPFEVDVTNESQVAALTDFARQQPGRLSVLVNNAGIARTGLVEKMSLDDWKLVLDVNLTGPLITCKAVLPILKQGGGSIVNIASVAGIRMSGNMSVSYTASKAGLIGLTRHLAYESAPWGVNINAICPGPVAAPMLFDTVPEQAARMVAGIPLGRLTTARDQAEAALFLSSPAGAMITGVALVVDGGHMIGWEDVADYLGRRGVTVPQAGSGAS